MATTTYEPIQTYTLGSTQATVTFSSIPSTYTDLILQMTPKTSDGSGYFQVFPNNDTGSNYSRTLLQGNGSSASSNRNSNSSNGFQMNCATSSQDANSYPTTVHLMNYANTNANKTALARAGSTSVGLVENYVWLYRSTSAITSLVIKANTTTFAAGSIFTLYGIANADSGAKATGGVITYDSTYYYHTFGASGTFTPQQSLTADVLVVAGGGGGGYWRGGGGGAGGLLGFASQSLTATGYTVTVGAGGAGGAAIGTNGVDSQFGSLTLVKGGGGGATGQLATTAGNGGSGGGGVGYSGDRAGGSNTSGQGNTGGTGKDGSPNYGAGGGGGANAVGGNGTTTAGGSGGVGLSTYSSWGLATGTGQNVNGTIYYAGGGGGATYQGGTPGIGGSGGGTAGTNSNTNATSALANTGGGGGGGGYQSAAANGGNGGSGVVIIRYPKA
jgi:hypothetical protein